MHVFTYDTSRNLKSATPFKSVPKEFRDLLINENIRAANKVFVGQCFDKVFVLLAVSATFFAICFLS